MKVINMPYFWAWAVAACALKWHGKHLIQQTLNRKLTMKPLPKLEFKVDTTEAKADEVERILQELGNE